MNMNIVVLIILGNEICKNETATLELQYLLCPIYKILALTFILHSRRIILQFDMIHVEIRNNIRGILFIVLSSFYHGKSQ